MHPELAELVAGLLDKNRRCLAQLISVVENREPGWLDVLDTAYSHSVEPYIIGITGPGGVGKSTLVSAMVRHLSSAKKSIAVIAVDPSSPISNGAFLGDRIRLNRELNSQVFYRSMASRGAPGGVAEAVSDIFCLLAAFKFDIVLVETVGTGQDQVEIAKFAHATVLVSAPGQGDRIQTMKAGLIEVADFFVVNKGDKPDADRAVSDLQTMLHLLPLKEEVLPSQVFKVVSTTGKNIDMFCDALLENEQQIRQRNAHSSDVFDRAVRLWRVEIEECLKKHLLRRYGATHVKSGLRFENPYGLAKSEFLLDEIRTHISKLFDGEVGG